MGVACVWFQIRLIFFVLPFVSVCTCSDIHYLSFSAGDQLLVYHRESDWWYGEVNGDAGFFAGNYCQLIDPNEPAIE